MTKFHVVVGDVRNTSCDILVLKYAQGFFGADSAIADKLGLGDGKKRLVTEGSHLFVPSQGRVSANEVLFLGVPSLSRFGYTEVREFGYRALTVLSDAVRRPKSVAMTMHGAGYGLDETEAFSSQVAGILDYLSRRNLEWVPNEIRFVELNSARSERLGEVLEKLLASSGFLLGRANEKKTITPPDAGKTSETKPHVFVAMPYDDAMLDLYEFGIKGPVNKLGCLCERCDHDMFTGDILHRIKERISTAQLIIAEMSGSNSNVYLEVGYAWGKEIPTLLLAKKGEELKFDVKTQKCVYYKNISNLREQLETALPQLIGEHRA